MTTPKNTKKIIKKKATESTAVEIPSLIDMLEAGIHFGHERSKKNPKMDPNIFMLRNRMAIIDLEKTQEGLRRAVNFVARIAAKPSQEILFVGTKRQAREIVKKYAEAANMPYVSQRWLGGMLTNFSTVLKSIEKLEDLKNATEDKKIMDKMTKKEKSVQAKEIERLEHVLEGTKSLKKPPAALIVVGSYDEKLAIREARRVGIPVVGITDTNANPELVDFAIPANDDAIRAIDLVVRTLTKAILKAQGKSTDLAVEKLPPASAKENEGSSEKPKKAKTKTKKTKAKKTEPKKAKTKTKKTKAKKTKVKK
jgi:small subunit ribosomal protein S2